MQLVTDNENKAFRRFFLLAPPILLNVPVALLGSYFAIYATDVLLIAPAMVGSILLIARIFDGVTDPMIGVWSDRRKGARRIPLIFLGALLYPALALVWLPPESLQGVWLFVWVTACYVLYELSETLRGVPVSALGLEVTRTPRQRVFVQVIFRLFALVTYLTSLWLMQHLTDHSAPREAIKPFILGFMGAYFVLYLVSLSFVRELPQRQRTEERPVFRMLKEVLANRYHRQFLGIQTAEVVAFACIGFAVPYVTRYVLDRPEMTMYVFLTNAVTAMAASFIWWRIIPRLGVRKSWLIGQYFWAAVLIGWVLVPSLGIWFFIFLAFLSGIGGAAGNCVGYAMLGDIADFDARESGRKRQGIYVTIYGLIAKLALAATAFVLGWILQASGYEPNAEQERGFMIGITLIVSVLPLIGISLSIRLLHRYRLYEDHGIEDGRSAFAAADRQPA
ncbi:MFS transporter [Qipengyuania sphaerica]|uniref:MFS transporter n=1 Tax=Qipengyuania sphaerica TaxID=2867243 RepID=UPI001C86FA52|nr:MFS transporter [Qipengyuania sphaerica]MBX7540158.1 MFS transporter [Qipengyuania sphaerica]